MYNRCGLRRLLHPTHNVVHKYMYYKSALFYQSITKSILISLFHRYLLPFILCQQAKFVRYVVHVNLTRINYARGKILNIDRVGIILGRQDESTVPLIPYAILAPNFLFSYILRLELFYLLFEISMIRGIIELWLKI